MRCPGCEGSLGDERGDGIPVLRCDSCLGEYVEREALVRLVAAHMAPPDARAAYARPSPLSDPVRYRTCPFCNQTMLRRNFHESSGVIVDVCGADGVWFDRGELAKVLEFASTGALAEADRRIAERAETRRRIDAFSAGIDAAMPTHFFAGLGW